MTACAYRSLEPVLHQRVADLRVQRERDAGLTHAARRVAGRRIGRALAGGTGVVLAGASFLIALASYLCDGATAQRAHQGSTLLLLTAWPAAFAVGALARRLAWRTLARAARVRVSGDAALDLARLEASDPLRAARDLATAWERRGCALPLAAMSLLAPLTLHAVVWAAIIHPATGGSGAGSMLEDFGVWIALSALLVGHAHLALLVCAVRWACGLCTVPTAELLLRPRACGRALLVSAGTACVPGALLFAIPPMLVLTTGACFVPAMYGWTVRTLERERTALEATA